METKPGVGGLWALHHMADCFRFPSSTEDTFQATHLGCKWLKIRRDRLSEKTGVCVCVCANAIRVSAILQFVVSPTSVHFRQCTSTRNPLFTTVSVPNREKSDICVCVCVYTVPNLKLHPCMCVAYNHSPCWTCVSKAAFAVTSAGHKCVCVNGKVYLHGSESAGPSVSSRNKYIFPFCFRNWP